MDVIAHPERIWRCSACGKLSGRAGHINVLCEHAATFEYVPAEQLAGAVSRDLVDRARLQIVNAIEARHGEAISEDEAWRVVTDALDRLGGQ